MRSRQGTDGFVMLEALVALVLLVLTVGLVTALLSFGQRVAGAAEGRDAVAHVASGTNALAGWLASASPFRPVKNTLVGPVLFEGRPDRLSFITGSEGDVQAPGLLAVTVGFGGHKAGALGTVLFEAGPLGLGETVLPDQVARTDLFGRVQSARFSYFGSPRDGIAADWRDDWTSATRLPRLVALDATVAVGSRLEVFHLTFRVRPE